MARPAAAAGVPAIHLQLQHMTSLYGTLGIAMVPRATAAVAPAAVAAAAAPAAQTQQEHRRKGGAMLTHLVWLMMRSACMACTVSRAMLTPGQGLTIP